jgi:hypothetical protein
MRVSILLPALLAVGCSTVTNPIGTRVIGAIAGFTADDPRIDLVAEGKTVHVKVLTYGAPCDSAAETRVTVSGLAAEVVPYDFRGDCPQRSLKTIEHAVTIAFTASGTASVTVRGIDASKRTSANPVGDTVAVLRDIVLR